MVGHKHRLEELSTCFTREVQGTLRNDDGDFKDNDQLKMNLYFTFDFAVVWIESISCDNRSQNLLKLKYVMPALNSKWKYEQISRRRSRSLKYAELSYSTFLCCREQQIFLGIYLEDIRSLKSSWSRDRRQLNSSVNSHVKIASLHFQVVTTANLYVTTNHAVSVFFGCFLNVTLRLQGLMLCCFPDRKPCQVDISWLLFA